jgi:YHS domain-containing protein
MAQDYVCGAEVDESDAQFFSEYAAETFYFCSAECKRRFDDHPDQFIRDHAKRTLGI